MFDEFSLFTSLTAVGACRKCYLAYCFLFFEGSTAAFALNSTESFLCHGDPFLWMSFIPGPKFGISSLLLKMNYNLVRTITKPYLDYFQRRRNRSMEYGSIRRNKSSGNSGITCEIIGRNPLAKARDGGVLILKYEPRIEFSEEGNPLDE